MRTYHYKTLKGLMRANNIRQFTLADFRRHIVWKPGVGSIRFTLPEEVMDEFARGIAGVIWSKVTEDRVYRVMYAKDMGILRRLWFDGKRYEYCAGQDYTGEIRFIQRNI